MGQPDYLCRSGKSCKNCPSLSCLPSLSSLFCVFLLIESICCLKVFFGTTLISLPASQIFHCHMFWGFLFLWVLFSTGRKRRRLLDSPTSCRALINGKLQRSLPGSRTRPHFPHFYYLFMRCAGLLKNFAVSHLYHAHSLVFFLFGLLPRR